MPVGGSRHYEGGGLGHIGVWHCPTCGEDNLGPLEDGCAVCGAGRPGRHVGVGAGAPPPAPPVEQPEPEERPRVSERAPDDPTYHQADWATTWAAEHPDVSVADAFRQGFLEGVRQARLEFQQQAKARPMAGAVADDMIQRTIVAALVLFRDRVLVHEPEETTTGEWLTAHQVTALIAQMRGEIHG